MIGQMRLSSHSLDNIPVRDKIIKIIHSALQAVDPYTAVERMLRLENRELWIAEKRYRLDEIHQIWVIGAGKAGFPMTQAVVDLLAEWNPRGCVIVKEGHAPANQLGNEILIREAGHPIPDQRGVEATQELIRLLKQVQDNDLVLCLISGGGSALFTAPAGGLSLQDLRLTTELLLKCGANIVEVNQVRKHLDIVKGGGVAKLIFPGQGVALILSDVLGDALDIIASGPTVPDPSTYQDAYNILARYELIDQAPENVVRRLKLGMDGQIAETGKPGEPCFDNMANHVIGSNYLAAQAACTAAQAAEFNTLLLTTDLQGEACQAGQFIGSVLKQVASSKQPVKPPAVIIAGGETTVTVHGDGLGGRNLELALGAVQGLSGLKDVCLITFATDGGDGPTDAAGAVVTGDTLRRALEKGLLPDAYLKQNNSYHFFAALDDLLRPGPTLTNVNDLCFGFSW
jgi:glycerate 2-kinase